MACKHRHLYSRLVFLTVGCLVFSSGALANNPPVDRTHQANLGREFKLSVGRQVSIRDTRLRIRFIGGKDDSRCPSDVTCVWGGNAAEQFQLGIGNRTRKVTLNTSKASSFVSEVTYQGYKVKLIELSPYPRSDRRIQPRDYTATLLVSKA